MEVLTREPGLDSPHMPKDGSVAIALEDLRCDRCRLETQAAANGVFDFYAKMGGIAHRA